MAALASSVSSWIPEDDLLLKNAVEGGASLEALAKGAVRFSRKFTVGELRDRWHSLLYDPVISAEASARMLEFELSASNNQSKPTRSGVSVDTAGAPSKRKVESVRRLYNALRKRTCIQPSNSPPSLLGPPNMSDSIGDGTACQEHIRIHNLTPVGSTMLGYCIQNRFEIQEMDLDLMQQGQQENNLIKESIEHAIYDKKNVHKDSAHILKETSVDFENCLGVEETGPSNALSESEAPFHPLGYSSPQCRTPLWKTIEDISAPAMPINVNHGDDGQGSEEIFMLPDDMDVKKISLSSNPESDLVDLSDSLLNLGNDDELRFSDVDGKDSTNKSCCDNINSVLLSSSIDTYEDVPDVKEPQTCLAIPDGSSHAELEVIAEQSQFSHGNQHGTFCSEANMPASTSIPNPQCHDLLDGEMDCTLNTEDPEIPCNDDIFPDKVVPSSTLQTSYKEASDLGSSFGGWKDSELKPSKMKREDSPVQHFPVSPSIGSDMFPGTSYNHPLFDSGVKSKSYDVNCLAGVYRRANNAHTGPTQCRSALEAKSSVTHAGLKEESLHASCATDVLSNAQSSATSNVSPIPEANTSTLDMELSQDSEESESDDHIPSFSDIESMILDLDLCPDDLDTCFNREVSRYQNDGTKRMIIRLEQCAQASARRAIAYQGAFALFYGRHLKHYIKKTEVTLGRATDDDDVDIDLGREGRANKISRRQALIKMEGDGSFILKNLGMGSIFLNGNEISKEQSRSLSSSSLIEIREMAFAFEINHDYVRRYLANVTKRNQEKNTNFEWSEEGFHDLRKPKMGASLAP